MGRHVEKRADPSFYVNVGVWGMSFVRMRRDDFFNGWGRCEKCVFLGCFCRKKV